VEPDDLERAYLAALRILNYRFNSETELRRKLRAKRFEPAVIDATLARLHSEKWLDDERFAGALVRTRARRGLGALRIKSELAAAGVSPEVSKRVLQENIDEEGQRASLKALCEKRMRMLTRRHGEGFTATGEGRNKLTAYLLKQGYDVALVESIIKELSLAHHQ